MARIQASSDPVTGPLVAVAQAIREAENHVESLSEDRQRATEYYRGVMKDVPSSPKRSAMVSRDVRAHVKKVLPSIMRTILGGEQIVEYAPVGQGDEAAAEQATDFVNHVLIGEADVRRSVESAIHDALLLRNGILHWWFEERRAVRISRHTGLSDDALAALVGDDSVEVLEYSETEESGLLLHEVKIRRVYTERKYRTAAVPGERFLIHPDAVSLAESPIVGERSEVRRSDLVAMGYARDLVDSLPIAGVDDESEARRDRSGTRTEADRANEQVAYYDVYARTDWDGDGIAELRHMVFAGGLGERNLLVNDECDEVQYCDIAIMRQPHQWEGISLHDDLRDLQQAKTVLLRQTLDNLYAQNMPQPAVQKGALLNPESLYSPDFGQPILIDRGVSIREAVQFLQVPMVADKSFSMLDYLDAEARDRTGITDASGGLPPDAIQNMTATASAIIEQSGIGQTELMVRTIAEGLRVFFRGLLRLIIRHQDQPRTVRLRDRWVEFDPRTWADEMDCTVNTGLGAGTRERDMAVMMQVLQLQERMVATLGPDNPFVKPGNVYAALAKMVESAGLRTPALYFTEPDEREIAAQQGQPKPSPEEMKLQAEMQLEQARMQAARDKEMAQMEADLRVKQAEIEATAARQRDELASRAALQEQQLAWERQKFLIEMQARGEEARQRAQADAIRPHLKRAAA